MGTVYNHTNLKFKVTIRSSSSSSSSWSSSESSSSSNSSSSSSTAGVGLDPENTYSAITLSNDNRTVVTSAGSAQVSRSVVYHTSGKRYFEARYDDLGVLDAGLGVVNKDHTLFALIGAVSNPGNGVGYVNPTGRKWQDNSYLSTGTICASGDVAMCAFDQDTGNVWFGKNGTWIGGGNPSAGTSPTATETELIGTSAFAAVCIANAGTDQMTVNFTEGVMVYEIPTGFNAWET
jgi:hypothetical protein